MMAQSNIKKILKEQGLTMYRLAKNSGLTYQSVHKIATAPAIPEGTTYYSLVRISQALDVKIDDLQDNSN